MDKKSLRLFMSILTIVSLTTLFQNCSDAKFTKKEQKQSDPVVNESAGNLAVDLVGQSGREGDRIVLMAYASMTGAKSIGKFTYRWSRDEQVISTSENPSLVIEAAALSDEGIYKVEVEIDGLYAIAQTLVKVEALAGTPNPNPAPPPPKNCKMVKVGQGSGASTILDSTAKFLLNDIDIANFNANPGNVGYGFPAGGIGPTLAQVVSACQSQGHLGCAYAAQGACNCQVIDVAHGSMQQITEISACEYPYDGGNVTTTSTAYCSDGLIAGRLSQISTNYCTKSEVSGP